MIIVDIGQTIDIILLGESTARFNIPGVLLLFAISLSKSNVLNEFRLKESQNSLVERCSMQPFQEEIFELLLAGKLKARNDSFYEVLFATLSSYIYIFLLLWLIQTKTEWKWERSCWNSCAYAVLCPCAHLSSLKLELTISIIFELFPPGGDNLTGWEVKHPSSRCVRGLKMWLLGIYIQKLKVFELGLKILNMHW